MERQKLRSELENQGILAPGSYAEAAKKGILGELQEAGIIQSSAKDEKYTLSSGSPVRRPPPRLTQLPPLKTQPSPIRDVSLPRGKDFSFVDYGRPAAMEKMGFSAELASSNGGPMAHRTTSLEEEKENDEFFTTFRGERIGEVNLLKMKLFDLDML